VQRQGAGGSQEAAGRKLWRRQQGVAVAAIKGARPAGEPKSKFVIVAQQGIAAEAAPQSSYDSSWILTRPR
jgi:hypothetical protein